VMLLLRIYLLYLTIRRTLRSTLFPYTTLFRSQTLFNETAYLRCLYGTCREVNDPATPLATQANVVAGFSFPGPTYFENADYLKLDRKSTRLNSSHVSISYAVFCLKKKKDGGAE